MLAACRARSGGPTGSFAAGRTLYGRQPSSSSRLPNARPMCGPKNLYGEQISTSTPRRRRRSARAARSGPRPPRRARPRRCASSTIRRTSGERADRVRRDRERDDPRPLGELPLEVVVVEREVVVDLDEADDDAEVVGELEPRRDVRVVVELRHEHLVARAQRRAPSARVRRKLSAVMLGPNATSSCEQPRKFAAAPARVRDERVGAAGRLVRRADVGVRLAQVAGDRVDHLVRALRAAGAVEEGERAPERRVARADCGDVEQRRTHASSISLPLTVQR